MFNNDDSVLHVYSQAAWHDDLYIVGTNAGLLALRRAIDAALEKGIGTDEAFVTDGEGFWIGVKKVESEEEIAKIALPYTDELASDKGEEGWPWQMDDLLSAIAEIRKKYMSP